MDNDCEKAKELKEALERVQDALDDAREQVKLAKLKQVEQLLERARSGIAREKAKLEKEEPLGRGIGQALKRANIVLKFAQRMTEEAREEVRDQVRRAESLEEVRETTRRAQRVLAEVLAKVKEQVQEQAIKETIQDVRKYAEEQIQQVEKDALKKVREAQERMRKETQETKETKRRSAYTDFAKYTAAISIVMFTGVYSIIKEFSHKIDPDIPNYAINCVLNDVCVSIFARIGLFFLLVPIICATVLMYHQLPSYRQRLCQWFSFHQLHPKYRSQLYKNIDSRRYAYTMFWCLVVGVVLCLPDIIVIII